MNYFKLGQSTLKSPSTLGKSGVETGYNIMIYRNGVWQYCASYIIDNKGLSKLYEPIIFKKVES